MIKTIVNGAQGKMGRVTVNHIKNTTDFELVAATDCEEDLAKIIEKTQADVVIDFTTPEAVFRNTKIILENRARPVIGTTGLTIKEIDTLTALAAKQKIGGLIAPNFALGAILMMRFAKEASQYFPHSEIIEMHHENKKDAPSGTALKTTHLMREHHQQDIPIHSVRLPGLFAHQAVIFGSLGETLTIRHDCLDRQAMMPGVVLGCRKVMELDHLVYGLENII